MPLTPKRRPPRPVVCLDDRCVQTLDINLEVAQRFGRRCGLREAIQTVLSSRDREEALAALEALLASG